MEVLGHVCREHRTDDRLARLLELWDIRHTLYMNSLLELPPSRQVRKAITAVCLLCACYLLVLLTTYYLLPTAYSLLLCLLCLLATCRSSRQASMEQSGRSSSSLKSDAAWWLSSTCVASSKQ